MNTSTRRIATTVAGVAIAFAGVAATGPAAHAGKPGGGGSGSTAQPLGIYSHYQDGRLVVAYQVPALPRDIRSTQCSIDTVTVPCDTGFGWVLTQAGNPSAYALTVNVSTQAPTAHRYTVKVTTKRGTYAGSVDFFGTASGS